jgi:hypothetical protein
MSGLFDVSKEIILTTGWQIFAGVAARHTHHRHPEVLASSASLEGWPHALR